MFNLRPRSLHWWALCLVLAAGLSGLALVGCSTQVAVPAITGRSVSRPIPRCVSAPIPDPACTPGALNPKVTQVNIKRTICRGVKFTATIRPKVAESQRLKRLAAVAYGITQPLSNYEGDHLVPLELGGAPDTTLNLWDEPHDAIGPDGQPAGSFVKDAYENYLNFEVCRGRLHIPLATAQVEMAHDWYSNYVAAGRPPDPYNHHH